MKTLRLSGGDLVLGPGGFETVSGADMIVQDLRGALGEPMGNDRFHPGWGSVIDNYVGLPQGEATNFEVQGEVERVVGNYMIVQEEKVRQDAMRSGSPRYSSADTLARVSTISVEGYLDQVRVRVGLETMARSRITFDYVAEGNPND